MSDHIGRKTQALISTSLLTIFIFTVGALTKGNPNTSLPAGLSEIVADICPVYGESGNKSGVYGYVHIAKEKSALQ